jgi:spore coat protein A, manganese oxidase
MDSYGRLKPMLGTMKDGVLSYHDPLTENPKLDSTEIWEIYNETVDAHPIHLHQVAMQLISRQKFSAIVDPVNGKPTSVRLIGNPKPALADEAGWKDTYVMYPGEVTRVIARFDLPGRYVWHCHILSHEDNEMMRPFHVGPIRSTMMSKEIVDLNTKATNIMDQLSTGAQQVHLVPNPFSTQLKVEVSLDKTAMISVNLYDTKGSRIQQVCSGQRSIGMHQFTIDGSNLTNGTYLCKILIDNKRITQKIVLQK